MQPVTPFPARPAVGLYRGEHEHDACGVAMVATLRGSAGHDIIDLGLTALRNLDHRGATGADPLVGDGAGILTQVPDRFLREVSGLALPPPGAYAVGAAFLPREEPARAEVVDRVGGDRRRRVAHRAGLARRSRGARPGGAELAGLHAAPVAPVRDVTGRAVRHRAGPGRVRAAQAGRTRDRPVLRVAVRADARLQGDAHHRTARAVLPGPVRPQVRDRAGVGPLAVLHQHLPVLATGPPLPPHRAQRRDQHGQGQPQLDAGARVDAADRPHPGRPAAPLPDLHAWSLGLGLLRRGPGAAAPGWALAAARRAHDDPGGVGEPHRDGPGPGGRSTSTTRCPWSRGTVRRA